jgi:hypothetical protein
MSDAVVQRLFWKEYRVQRGFWLSMIGLAIVGEIIVLLLPEAWLPRLGWFFGLALGCPAFYALGCGATLFAAEREDGTLEQLRLLSAPGAKVWWSKLAFALSSTILMAGLLLGFAVNLAQWRFPSSAAGGLLWSEWGVASLEFLAWGIFFSLFLRRPLHAACLAALATFVGMVVFGDWLGRIVGASGAGTTGAVGERCGLRLLVAAGLLAVDGWIASAWVLGRPTWRTVPLSPSFRSDAHELQRRALLASASAFVGVAILTTIFILGRLVTGRVFWAQFVSYGFLQHLAISAFEAIVWGVLYTLLAQRTARAMAYACAIAFLSYQFLILYSTGFIFTPMSSSRILLLASMALVDVWLMRRWILRARAPLSVVPRERSAPVGPTSSLQVLFWQERRQAWKTVTIFLAIAIAISMFQRMRGFVGESYWLNEMLAMATILATLVGSCTFLAEQEEKRVRFFADRGVPARRVWFAKHLVWFSATAVIVIVFYSIWLSHAWRYAPVRSITGDDLLRMCLLALAAFSSGQFFSILIPRGLVASLAGLILSSVILGWYALLQALHVNLWWAFLPIPASLLLATWLRAPDWMLDRTGWRPWFRVLLFPVLAAFALPAAVASVRVLEIPASGPGFRPQEFMRPMTGEERATTDLYRQAVAELRPKTPGDDWIEQNRECIELVMRASRQSAPVMVDPNRSNINDPGAGGQPFQELATLLMLDARRLEGAGQLDAALERYVAALRMGQHVATRGFSSHLVLANSIDEMVAAQLPTWAKHPHQTTDRVREALRQLELLDASLAPTGECIKAEYVATRRALMSDYLSFLIEYGICDSGDPMAVVFMQMPSERARLLRALDYRTAESLSYVASVESALARNVGAPRWFPTEAAGYSADGRSDQWFPIVAPPEVWGTLAIDRALVRRAVRLVMALEAWRAEHDSLPDRLEQLVGDYFDRLPVDPTNGKSFQYTPHGLGSVRLWDRPSGFMSQPEQALLFSTGPGNGPLGVQVIVGDRIQRTGGQYYAAPIQ